ncbi:inorganic phosphate transporter [Shewanella oneidensis MR-1]|uniref:Phosphate transporter n=1 Tax=Shewanella oneidensis (strain ATCC 700550 / JCM 31522 / CIP 106686 / LMG 19005 / NCIMB 14063 / MR-1) TaxID=211586 RepID=Q8EI01_SHEON|nr:inorganic phosphate transporter [Shewanella oneidensis]AAN54125.1 metal ion-phosphate:proton symporter PitB [Shewanella oneidensis MR-1]MDX5997072.1 inorganic phosphate transporter [Shewanella oneidensis]MEE2028032.1 Low-affinity inorganic phosphate transporter 1 [Shewanella oneidensis]QKG95871.1 inorganic phosphate transporter [Shewanella oneidensis MR-1]
MFEIFTSIGLGWSVALVLAVLFVLAYEFINGFHDTANAVATVIYTKAMPANLAVVSSALFNFAGVLLGGLGVAYAIVHLLPVDSLLGMDSTQGLLMVFSLLFSAIIWNLGTWYFGIPASSSHTLIGSIMGVGGAFAWIHNQPILHGINLTKATQIMLSLIISPTLGFVLAGIFLLLMKFIWAKHKIHRTPDEQFQINGKRHPPFWARVSLIASAMGVSFAHGSNDGQKGIGLVMLVLICMAPAYFALDMSTQSYDLARTQDANRRIMAIYSRNQAVISDLVDVKAKVDASDTLLSHCSAQTVLPAMSSLDRRLEQVNSFQDMTIEERREVRRLLLCIDDTARKVAKLELPAKELSSLAKWRKDLTKPTEYAPLWVIVAIATALGCGTLVGWRRIVYTVGEKIGSSGMTYSQGIAAQVTAAVSIGIASVTGMPVSTTHILSSAVAGTMVANRSGLQSQTIKQILLAWVLTLPITMLLSACVFILANTLWG